MTATPSQTAPLDSQQLANAIALALQAPRSEPGCHPKSSARLKRTALYIADRNHAQATQEKYAATVALLVAEAELAFAQGLRDVMAGAFRGPAPQPGWPGWSDWPTADHEWQERVLLLVQRRQLLQGLAGCCPAATSTPQPVAPVAPPPAA